MTDLAQNPIAIAGAGALGGWIGAALARAGRTVRLLARPSLVDDLRVSGMTWTDLDGRRDVLAFEALGPTADPAEAFGGAGLILVTVKGRDTAEMARILAAHAPADAIVVSIQNGVRNPERLRAVLTDRTVLAGMAPFNVLRLDGGRWHRGTEGPLRIEAHACGAADALAVDGLAVVAEPDMTRVLWAKTLINLNNALNALSGLSLRDELMDPGWRSLLADSQAEGLALLKAAGVKPAKITKLPPPLLPALMRLPTPLFRPLFDRVLKIDAQARSSMQDDLSRGRPTEIDDLQGEFIALAHRLGQRAPTNAAVAALIREAETAGGRVAIRPDAVRARRAQALAVARSAGHVT